MDVLSFGKVTTRLQTWSKFCYLQYFTGNNSTFRLRWNNETDEGLGFGVQKVRGGGIFILGQDQDTFGGGFNEDQSINAVIGDFRLYDYLLKDEQIEQFLSCRNIHDISRKPIIDFSNMKVDWILNGSVEVGEIEEEEICSNYSYTHVFYPEKRSFFDNKNFCNITKGIFILILCS